MTETEGNISCDYAKLYDYSHPQVVRILIYVLRRYMYKRSKHLAAWIKKCKSQQIERKQIHR